MPTKRNLGPFMRGDSWSLQVDFSDKFEFCDGACSTTAPTKITSGTAAFTTANLNQKITLAGAGLDGADYSGKIIGIDSGTQVTVCPSVLSSVSVGELTVNKAVNITGNLLFFTLKSDKSAADPVPAAPTAAGFQEVVTAPANAESVAGIGRITCPIAKTSVVAAPADFYYDIQRVIVGSPNQAFTPVYGTIPVLEDVSRNVV